MKMKHRERITQYSEAFKRKVVEEIERGELTSREAARTYGVPYGGIIPSWLRKYGSRKYETKIVGGNDEERTRRDQRAKEGISG